MTTLITTIAITQPMTTTTTLMLEVLEDVAEDVVAVQMGVEQHLEEVDALESVPRSTHVLLQAVKEIFSQGLSKQQERSEEGREDKEVS